MSSSTKRIKRKQDKVQPRPHGHMSLVFFQERWGRGWVKSSCLPACLHSHIPWLDNNALRLKMVSLSVKRSIAVHLSRYRFFLHDTYLSARIFRHKINNLASVIFVYREDCIKKSCICLPRGLYKKELYLSTERTV